MKLPELQNIQENITMINQFMGLNKNLRISEGEFSDMQNITNDYFPAISPRKSRGYLDNLTKPQGFIGGKTLCYVDDDKLYYDGAKVCDLEEGRERQMVAMGAYIAVFPDCILYNTSTGEVEQMNNEVTSAGNPTFTLCKLDGTEYEEDKVVEQDEAPEDTSLYWIDTSADPVVMKRYSTSTQEWNSIGTTYVKVKYTGIGKGFSEYDAATFEGVDTGIKEIYNDLDFNDSNIIYAADDDWVVIAGLINKVFTNSKPITITRKAPDMDFVCENDNRIYGCSSENHEIYACKLGDPKNWYAYMGLDSDSYAATVGTQTDFTGAVAYNGYVMFFKDDGYHRLYGTKPSNFEIDWKPCRGVQDGSDKSICIVNDYLMYKAREGVIIYDGTQELASTNLGPEPLYDAVAGYFRNKYYISMRDEDDDFRLYVFDTEKKTWCIEDALELKFAAYADGAMYMVNSLNQIYVVNEEKLATYNYPSADIIPSEETFLGKTADAGVTSEGLVEWSMTTGDIGLDSPYQKYCKRIDIRLTIDSGANLKVEASYDSLDDWEQIMEYTCTKKRSYSIPIPIRRCDHFKLRISGKGQVKIYSIAKAIENGGEA